jgi:hypothetical protein
MVGGGGSELHVRRDHGSTLRGRDKAENDSLLDILGHRGKLELALGVLYTNIKGQHG